MTFEEMKKSEDGNEFAERYCDDVREKIKAVVEKMGISQGELANKSGLGPSTVSKFLSGDMKISLLHVAKLCKALEISPSDVLALEESQKSIVGGDERIDCNGTLIENPSHSAFNGYIGTHYVYFNSTISTEEKILEGKLQFAESQDKKSCIAELVLDTGKKRSDGSTFTKHYSGNLVISLSMSVCYCILQSRELGEMCFLVFDHLFLFGEEMTCRMATVTTVSAGGNRRPAMHRLLISKECLDVSAEEGEDFNFVRGQLILNNSEIVIKKSKYEAMQKQETAMLNSDNMKGLLDVFNEYSVKQEVYFMDESKLREAHFPMVDKVKLISMLRCYSVGARYNKISTRTDEYAHYYIESKKSSK